MLKSLSAIATTGAAALVGSAVLVTGAAANTGLSAAHQGASAPVHATKATTADICYAQPDNDNGIGIVSQNFELDYNLYDSRAADDFRITTSCLVTGVSVNGTYFNGSGPAKSVHVIFYHSREKGRVGQVTDTQDKLAYDDPSGTGNFTVQLRDPILFDPGTYWVAVKANMAFTSGGEWGWNTNNSVRGSRSKWANPADGFATGCIFWKPTVHCIPTGEGPDFSFSLFKG